MRVLFVAINYNTAQHALQFAGSFPKERINSGELSLILVDNTQGKKRYALKEAIDTQMPYITCLVAPKNLGYFGGARYGLEYAKSAFPVADWVAVSNVDVMFSVRDAFGFLSELDPNRIGIVAPGIMSGRTGRPLNPYLKKRPAAIRMHAYRWLFSSYWAYLAYTKLSEWNARLQIKVRRRGRSGNTGPRIGTSPNFIYAPHGAFVFLGRAFFERGGNLRHEPFLYGEEITLAEQSRRLNLPVVYEPRISVMHEHQASTGRIPSRTLHRFVSEAAKYSAKSYF